MSERIADALTKAGVEPGTARPQPSNSKGAKSLFMLFHGWYGNLFLSRYQTGDLDDEGKDRGVKSALLVWESGLASFDGPTIRAAAEQAKIDHKTYPPTFPEFLAICKAKRVRSTLDEQGLALIPMGAEIRSQYTAKARADAMAKYRAGLRESAGVMDVSPGISGLLQLVASAVGIAGGNEAAKLLELERAVLTRSAA